MSKKEYVYQTDYYSWTTWLSYKRLEDRLVNFMQYVPPDDDNLDSWSPELANLHIIICTRLDSFFKSCLRSKTWNIIKNLADNFPEHDFNIIQTKSEKRWNIIDYLQIFDSIFDLKNQIIFFKPRRYAKLIPFSSWIDQKSPEWWKSYNSLKHDFYKSMRSANLNNVINAFSAYLLIFSVFPDSLSTLAYNKGVLRGGSLNLPAFIPRLEKFQEKIKEIENLNKKDLSSFQEEIKRSQWANLLPKYPGFRQNGSIIAESGIFCYLYNIENYNYYKKIIEANRIEHLFRGIESSPV